jgi:hypothetical protein
MAKIYKDYEDQYIANNIIYAAALPSEQKTNASVGIGYAFASEEPCRKGGKVVSAVKIDKETLFDRVLKGAIVAIEDPAGNSEYFIPVGFAIYKMNNGASFTDIVTLNAFPHGIATMHLVSSEAILDEFDVEAS